MAKAAPETIILKGHGIRKEAFAGGTITPGHLLQIDSAGLAIVNADAADANAANAYAVEDELQGNEMDVDYLITTLVLYSVMHSGEEVLAWLEAGADVAIGADLESAGDGTLQARTTGKTVAKALAALDLSASGAVATRLAVEVV